jgi:hypothetical protein
MEKRDPSEEGGCVTFSDMGDSTSIGRGDGISSKVGMIIIGGAVVVGVLPTVGDLARGEGIGN